MTRIADTTARGWHALVLGLSLLGAMALLGGCPQKPAGTTQTGTTTAAGDTTAANTGKEAIKPPTAKFERDFAFMGADGKQHMVSDFVGKPLVLNFWATWCPPCVGEMPHFQEVYASKPGQFNLVSVAVASSDDPKTFATTNGYTWTFGQVPDDSAPQMYGIQGIPATYFYDSRGQLVDQIVGSMTKEEFEMRLAKIL